MAKKSTKSVKKEIERVFYGDCPRCGASLKGQSFAYIYETELRKQKCINKYKVIRGPRPDLKNYIKTHIDTVELTEDEEKAIKAKAAEHQYPNQSRLAIVTDKQDTYCCTICGYMFTLQYEQPSDGTQEEPKKEPKKKQK